MTQQDIIELFRQESHYLGRVPNSQAGIIVKLADVIAAVGADISQEDFDALIHIGAVMYQEGEGLYRARHEVAETMLHSVQDSKHDP